MTDPGEPFDVTSEANEADLAEQAQDLDGGGSVDEYVQDADHANPADVLEQAQPLHGGQPRQDTILSDVASEGDLIEQRTEVGDDDEAYPREDG